MKTLPLACFIILLASCGQELYQVTNSSDIDLKGKAFVVDRNEIDEFRGDSASNHPLYAQLAGGEWLPSQCDDIDGNGIWDELVFLCDLKANESAGIRFVKPDSAVHFTTRTNIRFGRITKPFEEVSGEPRLKANDSQLTGPVYQMEGPAWENDMIAFRNYYDSRNGIDIYGKLIPDMVMDSVGVNGREYHTLQNWGMDILKVGNSLGAGAIALSIGDSLYGIGNCEEGSYELIAEGPVRSVLVLTYKNVPVAGRLYQVVHRISIYAGEHFYRSQVWVTDLKGDEKLVTGMVNMHQLTADTLSEGDKKILYSLGNQGISGEFLGMGLIFPASSLLGYSDAPGTGSGIVNTHIVSLKLSKENPTEYRFVALWENRDPKIKDRTYFEKILKESAAR